MVSMHARFPYLLLSIFVLSANFGNSPRAASAAATTLTKSPAMKGTNPIVNVWAKLVSEPITRFSHRFSWSVSYRPLLLGAVGLHVAIR
jgi:hypothetical protein